ncbi:hypothetical protein AAG906_008149 [Vitis piasezkii]
MAYFYMPLVKVEVTSPLAAAWIDDVIKCWLAAEIATFDAYGHVHPQKQLESTTYFYAPLVAPTSSTCDNATEIDEFFNAIAKTRVNLSPLNSQIEKYMVSVDHLDAVRLQSKRLAIVVSQIVDALNFEGVQANHCQSLKVDLATLDAKQEALKKELEQLGQECNVTQA